MTLRIPKKLTSVRGAHLLEVLISAVILGFSVLGLAPLLVMSIEANSDSRDRSIAQQLAKEQMEFLEASTALSTLPAITVEPGLQEKFTRTTTITTPAVDSMVPLNRVRVTVSISWLSADSTSYASHLAALLQEG